MDLRLPMFAIHRPRAAPQVGVELGAADIGLEPPHPAGAGADEGALHVEVAEALGDEQAHLLLRGDAVILHDRPQRRIAGQRHVARADRGLHHAQIFIVDIAEHRATAKGVAAAGRDAVHHEADLVQVEGAGLHRIAEFIKAERAVGLDVEAGQLLQHLEPRNTRGRRQQRLARHGDDIADLVLADRFGRLRDAAAGDGDLAFILCHGLLRMGGAQGAGGAGDQQCGARGQADGRTDGHVEAPWLVRADQGGAASRAPLLRAAGQARHTDQSFLRCPMKRGCCAKPPYVRHKCAHCCRAATALPGTRARRAGSAPLEDAGALFHEGGHAFLLVFRRGEDLEQSPLG